MPYYIVATEFTLDDLEKRIQETDLVPSRRPLLEDLAVTVAVLKQNEIASLAALRQELKSTKRREALSTTTGIDSQYLVLLRREIESYFPKPKPLTDFAWLPQEEIAKLTNFGLKNTVTLFEATSTEAEQAAIQEATGIEATVIQELICLADVSRVQWVSPLFARMLNEAGYASAQQIAQADPNELHATIQSINDERRYFKGKIGLRDFKRLVQSASYVPNAS